MESSRGFQKVPSLLFFSGNLVSVCLYLQHEITEIVLGN